MTYKPRRCVYTKCEVMFVPTSTSQQTCREHPCLIDGCKDRRHAMNYCKSHYANYKRHGDPLYARKIICNTLSDYECGRMAAYIDGEGSIVAYVHNQRETIYVMVCITNTDHRLMDYMVKTLGCGSITSHPENRGSRWKTRYNFHVNRHNDILSLLEQIKDHLLLKWEQAELVVQLLQIRRSLCKKHITEIERRIISRIRELNKKGC